jgi:hypothetical protein
LPRQITGQTDTNKFLGVHMGNTARHNLKASWIRSEQKRMSNVTAMEHSPITTEQVSQLIAKTLNWKAPGPDGISNFGLNGSQQLTHI